MHNSFGLGIPKTYYFLGGLQNISLYTTYTCTWQFIYLTPQYKTLEKAHMTVRALHVGRMKQGGTRLMTKVKQRRAKIVLGWVKLEDSGHVRLAFWPYPSWERLMLVAGLPQMS